jgi:hypothetical protein
MLEKLQLAEEETYKDPANIQSKHQKHQAFEAELGANADRIQSVLAMGQNLVNLPDPVFFFPLRLVSCYLLKNK